MVADVVSSCNLEWKVWNYEDWLIRLPTMLDYWQDYFKVERVDTRCTDGRFSFGYSD
ncbi:hypothetical protein COCNU_06G000120 [Cocos nucifera]|uniref:Uncharacterized protein n=1 Tax=Cocos nucifera TaxID=13894 RepID=A0A8K0I9B2_COCNU|nr:hypothetical protein COCNU_06G000120 [Cocos nucifera]